MPYHLDDGPVVYYYMTGFWLINMAPKISIWHSPPDLPFHHTAGYLLGGRVPLGERAFGQILTLSDHPSLSTPGGQLSSVYELHFAYLWGHIYGSGD